MSPGVVSYLPEEPVSSVSGETGISRREMNGCTSQLTFLLNAPTFRREKSVFLGLVFSKLSDFVLEAALAVVQSSYISDGLEASEALGPSAGPRVTLCFC